MLAEYGTFALGQYAGLRQHQSAAARHDSGGCRLLAARHGHRHLDSPDSRSPCLRRPPYEPSALPRQWERTKPHFSIERYRQRGCRPCRPAVRNIAPYTFAPQNRARPSRIRARDIPERRRCFLISRTPSPSSVTYAFGFHAIIVKHIHDATLKISAPPCSPVHRRAAAMEGNASYHRLSHLISIAVHHLTDTFDQQSIIRFANLSQDTTQWADYAFSGRVIMDGHSPRTQQSSHSRRFDDGICRQPSAHRSVNPPTEDLSVRQQPAGNAR